jgi:hypothetical protein
MSTEINRVIAAWERFHKKTQVASNETAHTDGGSMPDNAAINARQDSATVDVSAKKDDAPPDFYYPM